MVHKTSWQATSRTLHRMKRQNVVDSSSDDVLKKGHLSKRLPHRTKALAVLMLGGLVLGACSSSGSASSSTSSTTSSAKTSSSAKTLVMESSQESSVTENFNPFDAGSASSLLGANSMIYEPLYQFDAAKASTRYPWLATGYSWGNGGRSITFTIRSGVKFNNGSPMTAADVAFTYSYIMKNSSINTTGIPLTGVTSSGNTVTLTFSSPQYTALQAIASVYIVPKSIWSKVSSPATYVVTNPVGTGPYELAPNGFSSAGIHLSVNPYYWGGKPNITTVEFPTYTSASAAENALLSGQATWEGNFITNIKKVWETSPTHLAWFAPVNTNAFWPNLHTFPTDQLAVRKAISLAINRTVIGKIGESGLEAPATNASGLTLPLFQNYLTPAAKKLTLNVTPDIAAAKKVLEKAGWVMKGKYFYKGGQELKFQIADPANYSDYAEDGTLAAAQLQQAGMDVTFNGMSDNGWDAAIASGNFQLMQHWSQTSVNPYYLYDNWLNSAVSSSAGNFERLDSPQVDSMLNAIAAAPNVAAESQALLPIEKYVADNLPIIPTVYGAAFMEANASQITGWPSPSNPYESGSPNAPTNEVVVLHLK